MKPIQLNGSKLVREIRKQAREHPDTVQGCRYVYLHSSTPCCIVGVALVETGQDTDIEALRDTGAFANAARWNVSERYRTWISRVQSYQDGGLPWARAVEAADDAVGKVW